MPRTHSLTWSELKIGILTLFAIVMATVMIFLLSGEGGFFWQRYPLKTIFPNVAGLKPGAPVRVAGVEVGSVTDVQFLGERVEVVMELSEDIQPLVTTGSTAALGSVSLLGEAAVDITASSEGAPIPPWGYVPSGEAAGSLTEVAAQATEGLEEATRLLADIRDGRGTVGRLFTEETLYNEITAFVDAAEGVARGINEGEGTLGRLARDPAAARALEASLQNLAAVTDRIRAGEGTLGRLLTEDALARSAAAATDNLQAITGRIRTGEGTMGRLVTDDQLYERFHAMAERLDTLIASLNQGEGTAGQLLQDRQLYENMNAAVSELRNLVQDIRADPRRFLNVRVSLF